jgi:hypothetical protein
MRYSNLRSVNGDTPLAQLFNACLSQLNGKALLTLPIESMSLCRQAFTGEVPEELPMAVIAGKAQRHYELSLISNAFDNLHDSLQKADKLLTEFFDEYKGDFKAYAEATRLRSIAAYGLAEADAPAWYTDEDQVEGTELGVTQDLNADKLQPYTLHAQLAPYFPGYDLHGEFIGTSTPDDIQAFLMGLPLCAGFGNDYTESITFRELIGEIDIPQHLIDQIRQVFSIGRRLNALYTSTSPNVRSHNGLSTHFLLWTGIQDLLALEKNSWFFLF